jgi:L-lysine 2,3-aminomutase
MAAELRRLRLCLKQAGIESSSAELKQQEEPEHAHVRQAVPEAAEAEAEADEEAARQEKNQHQEEHGKEQKQKKEANSSHFAASACTHTNPATMSLLDSEEGEDDILQLALTFSEEPTHTSRAKEDSVH